MFTYIKSIVKDRGYRPRWREEDTSTLLLKDHYINFLEVVLVLHDSLQNKSVGLDIKDITTHLRPTIGNETIDEFFTRIGNTTLPVSVDNIPNLEVIYATFKDARIAGYTLTPVPRSLTPELPLDKSDLVDLKIHRTDVDPLSFYENCLVTVNGLFHRTNYTGEDVRIVWGGRTGYTANKFNVGIYNLGKLGKLSIVPIRYHHVTKNGVNQPLSEVTTIKIDEEFGDLTNKSVLVCIGGYLHLPGQSVVKRVGDRLYNIDFKDYPLAQRFYEMKHSTNIKKIDYHFAKSTVNPQQLAVEDLLGDKHIEELLDFSQSFFVIIDTPEIFLDKFPVEFSKFPGRYYSYELPRYPLMMGDGKIYEYMYKKELDRYVLSTEIAIKNNYLFETTPWKEGLAIDSSREPSNLYEFSKAFFWKLGRNK